MGRQYAVIALAADGKLRSIQMSHSGLEYLLVCSMVNGQLDIDLRDGNVSHNPIPGSIQHLPVFGILNIL